MNIENATSPVDVYLHTVGTHLRPLPRSERTTILEEIKSRIEELRFFNGFSIEAALNSLGDPRALAKQYLANALEKSADFGPRTLLIRLSLSISDDTAHVAMLSALSFSAVGAILFGIATIVYGFVETGRFIMGYRAASASLPFGPFGIHPLMGLLVFFLTGLGLIAVGMVCWRLLRKQSLAPSTSGTHAGSR